MIKKNAAKLTSLTLRQQRFVQEYVRHGNGTAAAVTAGYCVNSRDGAAVEAHRMLNNPKIKAIIEDEREAMRQAARLTREDLLVELATLALADPADVLSITKDSIKLRTTKQMGRARRTIQSVSETPGEWGTARKVTFHDKRGAINDLWEKLGFDSGNTGRDRQAFADAIRGALGRAAKRK